MNTPAIQGAASILPTPSPAKGSVAPSGSPEGFNQVLQREVSERRGADQASAQKQDQSSDVAQKQPAAQSSAEAGTTESVASRNAKEATSEDQAEQLSEADTASNELIALVASMMQITLPAEASPTVSVDEGAAHASLAAMPGKGKALAVSVDDPDGTAQADDAAQDTQGARASHPDFLQAARESSKGSAGNASQSQPPSGTQAAAAPVAAVQSDSAPADQAAPLADSGALAPGASAPGMAQAVPKMQNSANQLADKLTPPVGTPAWDQAVGQKVVWMVNGAQQSASLTLNPPDLGPMQIVLNVNNAQASASFVAAQPEVRQALEAALPKLREMLGDAGIQLGQANISAGTPQHGGSSDGRERHVSQRAAHGEDAEQASTIRQQPVRPGRGMVDTFA